MPTRKREVKGWVGLTDGDVCWCALDPSDMWSPRAPRVATEFFRTRKAAREVYEDVRRATLVIEPEPRRRKGDDAR